MAPTAILAVQHFKKAEMFFSQYDIECGILIGGQPKKEKDTTKSRIQTGQIRCIIGTHALIQDDVVFEKLGFVIIDEQHRF